VIRAAVMATPPTKRATRKKPSSLLHVKTDVAVTREMPPLEMRAEFAASTLDVEKRTVQLTWTTGARVMRGFYDRYWEELSLDPKHVRMERLNSGAPLLDTHRADGIESIIGVVVDGTAKLQKSRGVATVRFDSGPRGEDAMRRVGEGTLRNVSVGYRVHRLEKVEEDADKVPVFRATDWEPHELTLAPIGADAGATVRSEDSERNQCVFITRQEIKAMDDDDKDETNTPSADKLEETVAVNATRAARTERIEDAKARAEAEARAADAAVEKERSRIAGIHKVADDSGLGAAWAQKLVRAGVSVEKAREAAFEYITNKETAEFNPDGTVRVAAGEDERDKFIRGASAWLFERTNTRKMLEAAKLKSPDSFKDVAFDGGEWRGHSPVELARICVERAGIKTRGMDRMRMIGLAFTTRSTNYQVTGDFPNILENVLGKVLLGAYLTQASTWQRFCGVDTVPDFRTSNRYRTGSLPSLAVIAEHGEYTSAAIPDASKYALSTQRLGRMFAVSQETIINDDMGALTQMAIEIGRSGQRTIENAVFALLALNSGLGPTQSDSQPFFHANRANVNATGSAISVAGIDADRVVMRAQKDPNNLDFLDLTPDRLLVPDSLKGTAQVINDAQYDPDTANKLQRPNMVRGLFSDIIGTPRLAASSTRRYLFADPNIAAAIVVAFLEGYGQGPVMDTMNGWRVDGVEWKVSLYAKPQMADPKAAVTNAGV
jgi:hypothetical protein